MRRGRSYVFYFCNRRCNTSLYQKHTTKTSRYSTRYGESFTTGCKFLLHESLVFFTPNSALNQCRNWFFIPIDCVDSIGTCVLSRAKWQLWFFEEMVGRAICDQFAKAISGNGAFWLTTEIYHALRKLLSVLGDRHQGVRHPPLDRRVTPVTRRRLPRQTPRCLHCRSRCR